MKNLLITFFTVLFCLTSSVGWSLEYKDLVKRDGVHYKKFSDVPFSGKTTGQTQGSFKNGKKDGSWIGYYDNGQLWYKENYKNGKKDGFWIEYWDDGQLMYKGNHKNGKKEGSWVGYSYNGNIDIRKTGTFKNGKKIRD